MKTNGNTTKPLLYQLNTRVWLTELSMSRRLGQTATLDDIPDAELDSLAEMGFDWVCFLSVWTTGLAGQKVSRSNPERPRETYRHAVLKPCKPSTLRRRNG